MSMSVAPPWALILAGGDGMRLRPLTRQIAGDARPKQFCAMVDGETLLDRTRRRIDGFARFDRQLIVVTRPHEPYYGYLDAHLAPGRLVVQPRNRGTGPGVLYPLLRLGELAGDVPVAVFPADHFIDDDAAFIAHVEAALRAVCARPDRVALLGIDAATPETEYGWIEPAATPWPLDGPPVFPIRRFWEKPSRRLAERLLQRGCLWNSFVMVGWVRAFLSLLDAHAPALLTAFNPLRAALGSAREGDAAESVYAALPAINFSERVLAQAASDLVTLRVKGIEWSDWGHPQRVLATIRRTGWQPAWLGRVQLAPAG